MGSVSDSNRGPLAAVVVALAAAVGGIVATQPRTIGVAFADGADWTGWRPEHRAVLASALVPLAATGDRWVIAPEALADVVVRTYDSQGHCEHAGAWIVGSREVRIDYACLHGPERLRYAVVHELLHQWAGSHGAPPQHVCRHAGDAPDCNPVVTGVALMNPTLPSEFDEQGEAVPATAELTQADISYIAWVRTLPR